MSRESQSKQSRFLQTLVIGAVTLVLAHASSALAGQWRSTAAGLPEGACWGIFTDPASASRLFTYCDRLYESDDRGSTWSPRGVPSPGNTLVHAFAGGSFFAIGTSYATGQVEIDSTSDLGQTWNPMTFPAFSGSYALDLQPDPSNPEGLLLLMSDALLRSPDLGVSWVSIGPKPTDAHPYLSPSTFLVDPHSSSVIHLNDSLRGMLKTRDGGASWYEVNTGFPSLSDYSSFLVGIGEDSSVLYAIFGTSIGCPSSASSVSLRNAQDDEVPPFFFRSIDGGESWEQMVSPPGDTSGLRLAIDPRNPLHVFGGTIGYCWIGSGDAYETTDGGQTWVENEQGLPRTHILQLVLSTDGTRLFAATTSGIFQLLVARSAPRLAPIGPVTVAPIHPAP